MTEILDVSGRDFAAMVRAVLPCVSKDTMLSTLMAVQLRVSGGELTLTTTDRFTIARDTLDCDQVGEDASILVSVEDLKRIAALVKGDVYNLTRFDLDDDRLTVNGDALTARGVDGEFPNLDRILESAPNGEQQVSGLVEFSGDYLARFAGKNLARDRGERGMGVRFALPTKNGGVARVTFSDHFTGAIMARRIDVSELSSVA